MSNYRVAMIMLERLRNRPECHAWHYAPFLDACDPRVLFEGYPSIHQWFCTNGRTDHFNDDVKLVEGFEITKVWDIQSVERAGDFARLVHRGPKVCERIEETWEDVDAAFIADGGGDGSLHVEFVTPFLERGIPVFVDKPFAREYKDAKTMVDLAVAAGTPLMSASILSHVNEIADFRARWDEIPPVGLGVVKGRGAHLGAIIHGLALAQGIFGGGVDWVECMGAPSPEALSLDNNVILPKGKSWTAGSMPLEVMMLHYPVDDLAVLVLNTNGKLHDYFSCEVWGRGRRNPPPLMHLHSAEIGDPEFLGGTVNIVRLFKQMLDTKQPPISYELPLELMAIVDAGREAQRARRRVYLREITT